MRDVSSMYRRARSRLARTVLAIRPDSSLTPFERFKRDGHASLLLEGLGLAAGSVVLDVGGYLGDYTAAITERYGCAVHVYEPIPAFAKRLRSRFSACPFVVVHEYAIAPEDGTGVMRLSSDATGAFADGEPVDVVYRSAEQVARSLPERIDVAAINIEGGEYELLPLLAEVGLLGRIDRVFVQFHEVGDGFGAARERCREVLGWTHEQLWCYDFVWEAWVSRRAGDAAGGRAGGTSSARSDGGPAGA